MGDNRMSDNPVHPSLKPLVDFIGGRRITPDCTPEPCAVHPLGHGDCLACSVGNPGVYVKDGRMVCPHRPE